MNSMYYSLYSDEGILGTLFYHAGNKMFYYYIPLFNVMTKSAPLTFFKLFSSSSFFAQYRQKKNKKITLQLSICRSHTSF